MCQIRREKQSRNTERESRKKRETQIRREPDSASRPALPFFCSKSQIAIGSRVSSPWRSQKKSLFSFAGQRAVEGGGEKYLSTDLPILETLAHTHTVHADGSPDRLLSYYFDPEHSAQNEIFSRILPHAKKKDPGKIPPPIHDIRKRHQKHNVRLAGTGWLPGSRQVKGPLSHSQLLES